MHITGYNIITFCVCDFLPIIINNNNNKICVVVVLADSNPTNKQLGHKQIWNLTAFTICINILEFNNIQQMQKLFLFNFCIYL